MADEVNNIEGEPMVTEDSSPTPAAEATVEVEDVSSDEEGVALTTRPTPPKEEPPEEDAITPRSENGAPAISAADLSVLGTGDVPNNNEENEQDPISATTPETTGAIEEPLISEADMSVLEASEPETNTQDGATNNVEAGSSAVEFSPSPTAAEATVAFAIDDSSVKTEESADDSSSSSDDSDSDSDSVSTESSHDSSSSSSSEDPSVINGIRTEDIIYDEDDTEDEMKEVDYNNVHNGHFTIDDEEEEDARDAILLKEDVFPERSPLYDDVEEGKTRSAHRKMMRNRAMVRKIVLQHLQGRRRWINRGRKSRGGAPRDIPLHWNDEAAHMPRRSRGWTHRNKRRRFIYAVLSVMVFVVGLSLMIYGIARQREYHRTEAALADDEYYDDYYYDDEYDDSLEDGMGGSGIFESNGRQPTPMPSVDQEDELLELLKLAYKSVLHSFPPTTETLHIIDSVETDLLNRNVQSQKSAFDQSVQWRAYLTLLQRDDVLDESTNEPIMEEELIMQLYSLTCFFYNFIFAQELNDECQWTGIRCDDVYSDTNNDVLYPSSDNLRVVSISLPNESLTGTLPVELIFLSHLETIDLSNNLISGSLPQYFSQEQQDSLKVLSLHDNRFEGSIPAEISKLKHLQKVRLTRSIHVLFLHEYLLHFCIINCVSSLHCNTMNWLVK